MFAGRATKRYRAKQHAIESGKKEGHDVASWLLEMFAGQATKGRRARQKAILARQQVTTIKGDVVRLTLSTYCMNALATRGGVK